ncbi:hypothetical protein JOM56_014334 [Amanita muscaria]
MTKLTEIRFIISLGVIWRAENLVVRLMVKQVDGDEEKTRRIIRNGPSQMQMNSYPNQEYLNLVGNAPAEVLLSSANEAYMRIHEERNQIELERDELNTYPTSYEPATVPIAGRDYWIQRTHSPTMGD